MALDTLSLIAETVASLLGDSVKNRLKPKTSADIAKAKALQLYQVLGKIDEETTFYIKNFETYLSTFASRESKESLEPLKEELKSSVIKIWELIERLQKALDNINPQLEIHNHELVKNIITFRGERMGILATQTMNYGNNLIQDTPAKKSHDKKVQINSVSCQNL